MISEEQRETYFAEGFFQLPKFIPGGLLDSFRSELDEWLALNSKPDGKNLRYRFKNETASGALVLDAIDPVLDLLPSLEAIAHFPPLLSSLAALFGEEAHLFKDKLILKQPGVGGYPLHQDFVAWPDFPRSFTTVVIPLDPTTRMNGCLEVFPRIHVRGCLAPLDGDFHDLPETSVASISAMPLELAVGDLAIFGCFVPHRSQVNRSSRPRRQLYLSYNRASELGNYRSKHYESHRGWLTKRYADFGGQGFYFK